MIYVPNSYLPASSMLSGLALNSWAQGCSRFGLSLIWGRGVCLTAPRSVRVFELDSLLVLSFHTSELEIAASVERELSMEELT